MNEPASEIAEHISPRQEHRHLARGPVTRQWPLANRLPPMGALPTAPATIRSHAAGLLTTWGLGDLADTARTIVSELVANTVRLETDADGSPLTGSDGLPAPVYVDGRLPVVQFGMFSDRTVVLIEIWDTLPGSPERQQPGTFEEHGRGLAMVEALSDQWGVRPDSGGKVVWARLQVPHPPSRRNRSRCPLPMELARPCQQITNSPRHHS